MSASYLMIPGRCDQTGGRALGWARVGVTVFVYVHLCIRLYESV